MSGYKVLILIAHADADKKATAYRLADVAEKHLAAAGKQVKKMDLTTEGFSQTIQDAELKQKEIPESTKKAQELVTWCDHILIVGPMWFFRFPACLYTFIERVFSYGFGFTATEFNEKGPLKGRKVSCIITSGAPAEYYSKKGAGPIDLIMYPTTCSFWYCGIAPTRTLVLGNAGKGQSKAEEEWMEKYGKAVAQIENWKLVDFKADQKLCETDNLANLENCNVDNIFTK